MVWMWNASYRLMYLRTCSPASGALVGGGEPLGGGAYVKEVCHWSRHLWAIGLPWFHQSFWFLIHGDVISCVQGTTITSCQATPAAMPSFCDELYPLKSQTKTDVCRPHPTPPPSLGCVWFLSQQWIKWPVQSEIQSRGDIKAFLCL